MGQVEGLRCQPGIKTISLMCPFGVQDSGSQRPLHACLFRLCFPCFASALPITPSLCPAFLLLSQMQLAILHVRTNRTSEETITPYRFTHRARKTVPCRRDFSTLGVPMPKCLSRFSRLHFSAELITLLESVTVVLGEAAE